MTNNVITLQIGGAIDLNLRMPPVEGCVKVTAKYNGFVVISKGDKVAYTLPVGKLIDVQISYVDSGGNPASVDGIIAWETSNSAIANIEPNTNDSTMCRVIANNDIGDCQITARADADLGSGTREIVTFLDMHVIAGEAVAGTINVVGEPQPIS